MEIHNGTLQSYLQINNRMIIEVILSLPRLWC